MQQAIARAAGAERRMSAREIFALLDGISRTRALTNAETTDLARAIKIIDGKRGDGPKRETQAANAAAGRWTKEMDKKLVSLRKGGKTFSRIAKMLGVSTSAAGCRWHRLHSKEG